MEVIAFSKIVKNFPSTLKKLHSIEENHICTVVVERSKAIDRYTGIQLHYEYTSGYAPRGL